MINSHRCGIVVPIAAVVMASAAVSGWSQPADGACGVCHAFGSESEGKGLAPDFTALGSTVTREFILQSILEPSATINGRFFHTKFTLKNGDVVTGSVIDVADKKILVAPVMMNPQATVEIAEADVKCP